MSKKTRTEKTELGNPIPLKLDGKQLEDLQKLNDKTGLNRAIIMRVGLNFFIDGVMSGEIDLAECVEKFNRKPQAA